MTTPTNGAPGSTPSINQPAAKAPAAAPAAPQTPDEVASLRQQLAERDARLAAADKKLRVNGVEVMKVATEKKAMGAKLSEHSTFDAAFKAAGITAADLKDFKINPKPVLQKAFGDGWYEKLLELRLNGDVPSADVVASQLARTKEEIRAELKAEAEAEKAAATKAAQERDQQAREQLQSEAAEHLEKAWSDYPVFDGLDKTQVARAVAQHIENVWRRTGKVLTAKEATEALEQTEVARAERLAAMPKYGAKLTEKLKPATVVPVATKSAGQASRSTEVERRTLSNDLTATTTPAKKHYRTDEERLAAVNALNLDR